MLNEVPILNVDFYLPGSWLTLSPSVTAAALLLIAFAGFAACEKLSPKAGIPIPLLQQSYKANFSLFMFNSLIMSLLSVSLLWAVAKQHLSSGILSYIPNASWKAVIALLSLDLLHYAWHRACHRFDGLWMFHKVHHNDPYLNVSTGFRIHIVELFMTYCLKALAIIALGVEELIVLVSEVVTTLFIMFHHTNSEFKGEKWFGYVFTTPSLHRTHHSVERHEHDRNYGAILSVWDRLFGTLLAREPAAIGINGSSPQDFINLVKFGFVEKLPAKALPANLETMIAEAAYYKAEKRNFNPGREWDDWLAAKQEILEKIYGQKHNRMRQLQG